MSKQKPATKAETPPETPPAAPDPAVVAVGSENAPPASDPPPEPALQLAVQAAHAQLQDEAVATAAAADVQDAAADPPSGDPELRRPRAVMPDADAAAAISGFLADWREDTPAEAAGGSYSPHTRDRFSEQDHSAIPDGLVFSKGWVFAFEDGRFVAAADITAARDDVFVPKGQFIHLSPV